MIDRFLPTELTTALGWTLVHALWQGAAFALLLGMLLVVMRRYTPRSRYLIATTIFGAFICTALFTFTRTYVAGDGARDAVRVEEGARSATMPPATATTTVLPERPDIPEATTGRLSGMHRYFERHLPLFVTVWLLGILLMQLRFLGQLAYVQRLKHYGNRRFPAEWAATIQGLEEKLGLRRRVRYLLSTRVSTPLTVGWWQPAVLFPDGLLEDLRESEVVSILAHELAHIRRNDYLVGLLQGLATTFFFFHPGVWWMNARIAEEREHCCDDLAVSATGKRIGYAKTLVELQAREIIRPRLAMAVTGAGPGGLTHRINRLVKGSLGIANFQEGLLTGIILCSVGGLAVLANDVPVPAGGANVTAVIAPEKEVAEGSVVGEEMSASGPAVTEPRLRVRREPRPPVLSPAPAPPAPETHLSAGDSDKLLEAIRAGRSETVAELIRRGVDVNRIATDGITPLVYATGERRPNIMQLLLDAGADPDLATADGWTPLMEAARTRCTNCLSLLVAAGADPTYANADGHTALLEASRGNCSSCLKIMETAVGSAGGDDCDCPDDSGGHTVTGSVGYGGINGEVGYDGFEAGSDRGSDLGHAIDEWPAWAGMVRARNLLHGQNISSLVYPFTADNGDQMIYYYVDPPRVLRSVRSHSADPLIAELKAGEDVNAAGTRIRYRIRQKHLKKVDFLNELSADRFDAYAVHGWTPLMDAAERGYSIAVKLLLDKGADPALRNSEGMTALDVARAAGRQDVVRLLKAFKYPKTVEIIDIRE